MGKRDSLDRGEMVDNDVAELGAVVEQRLPERTASPSPDQIAEVNDRHQQFQARVAELSNVLTQDAAAVLRATRDGSLLHNDEDWRRLSKRARRDYDRGTFVLNRLGAEGLLDPTLSAVLLELRRELVAAFGSSAPATILIDQAVVAYHTFIRVTGWAGNTALMVEAEFFGRDLPSAEFHVRYGREGRRIRGLTVEQHIARLGEQLLPLAERFGRIMRQTVVALEEMRSAPTPSVERSAPLAISVASVLQPGEVRQG